MPARNFDMLVFGRILTWRAQPRRERELPSTGNEECHSENSTPGIQLVQTCCIYIFCFETPDLHNCQRENDRTRPQPIPQASYSAPLAISWSLQRVWRRCWTGESGMLLLLIKSPFNLWIVRQGLALLHKLLPLLFHHKRAIGRLPGDRIKRCLNSTCSAFHLAWMIQAGWCLVFQS